MMLRKAMLIQVLKAPEGASSEHIIGLVADVVQKKTVVLKSEKPLLLLVEEFDGDDEKALKNRYEVEVRVFDPDYIPKPPDSA